MWRGTALLAGLLLTLVGAPAAGQARVRVEGVAAWVGGGGSGPAAVAILRSDVELRARLRLAGRLPPHARLPPALLAATLDEIISEVLIALEADRLRAAHPDAAEVARERARLATRVGGSARLRELLEALDASPAELRAMAERRAYVDAFLRANLEGSTLISDAQVQRAYEGGEHPFGGRPLESVRELLRAWLAREALQRDVARWVAVLHERTRVRILAEWRADE